MTRRRAAVPSVVLALLGATGACAASRPVAAPASPAAPPDPAVEAMRRLIGPGSIIADVQLGRTPPMAVGACVHPVDAARFELDRALELVPDRPPIVSPGSFQPRLPESLRDSKVRSGVVVARWVVDTSGAAIPGSVSIVSSPHGLMSAQVCVAVLAARFTPASDDGRLVRARVEMPVRFVP